MVASLDFILGASFADTEIEALCHRHPSMLSIINITSMGHPISSAGMLQTESPYFQLTPPPPAPFAAVVGDFPGDPDYTCAAGDEFSGCDESWAVIITESENIFVAGAGVYSWFSTYAQTCIDTQKCQKTLVRLDSNYANVRVQNLITIGAKYMVAMDGKGIAAADNLNVNAHPFGLKSPSWTLVAMERCLTKSFGLTPLSGTWTSHHLLACHPAMFGCHRGREATSTVDYPLLTVSDGTWTSTVTQAPVTISQWVFEVVTLTQEGSSNLKSNVKALMRSCLFLQPHRTGRLSCTRA